MRVFFYIWFDMKYSWKRIRVYECVQDFVWSSATMCNWEGGAENHKIGQSYMSPMTLVVNYKTCEYTLKPAVIKFLNSSKNNY